MIDLIFYIVAPICKAVADTVDHHFDSSIFKTMNPSFWDRDISSDKARRIFNYKVDAWHLSLSAMIVLFILAAVFHKPRLPWYSEVVIGGGYWNLCFNLFYNHILRKK